MTFIQASVNQSKWKNSSVQAQNKTNGNGCQNCSRAGRTTHTHTPLTVCLIILKFLEVIFWEHQAKRKQAGRQADHYLVKGLALFLLLLQLCVIEQSGEIPAAADRFV